MITRRARSGQHVALDCPHDCPCESRRVRHHRSGQRPLLDSLQVRVLVFDKGHEIDVVVVANDEDALAGVALGIRVFQEESRSPRSMWNTTSSKPMPRSFRSLAFFASTQSKYFTSDQRSNNVCSRGTQRRRSQCAQTRPGPVDRQPACSTQNGQANRPAHDRPARERTMSARPRGAESVDTPARRSVRSLPPRQVHAGLQSPGIGRRASGTTSRLGPRGPAGSGEPVVASQWLSCSSARRSFGYSCRGARQCRRFDRPPMPGGQKILRPRRPREVAREFTEFV